MNDSYNSDFTGLQVDEAITKITNRGVTTKDSTTTLENNKVIIGDVGGRTVQSSNVSKTDLENAVTHANTFNTYGVTTSQSGFPDDDEVVVTSGSHGVSSIRLYGSDVIDAARAGSEFTQYGLTNGPIKEGTGEIETGNLVCYGAIRNEIEDSGVSVESISTSSVGISEVGDTGTGFIPIRRLPGFTVTSDLSMTASLENPGSSAQFGAPVLYYGRNLFDVEHVRGTKNISSLLGKRNTAYVSSRDGAYGIYTPSLASTGFTFFSTLSGYTNAEEIEAYHNQKYLLVSKWILVSGSGGGIRQKPFRPRDAIICYETTIIGQSEIFGVDEQGNVIDWGDYGTEYNPVYNGGIVYTYSIISVDLPNGSPLTSWCGIRDYGTTTVGDRLDSMYVINISNLGEDAIDIATSSDKFSAYELFSKYFSQYDTLCNGQSIQDNKYSGYSYPNNVWMGMTPYSRNLFIKVPQGLRLYIQEYGRWETYLKTLVIDAPLHATNALVVLDGSVMLGTPSLFFLIDKSDGSGKPSIGTDAGELAPTNASATEQCAPLIQYVPQEYVGHTIDVSSPDFSWVRYYMPKNLLNGYDLQTNNLTTEDYRGVQSAWTSTEKVTRTCNISEIISDDALWSDANKLGVIAFQTNLSLVVKFDLPASILDSSHTFVQYPVSSLSRAILQVEQMAVNIDNYSILANAPTAPGTYKYIVQKEGSAGEWVKESYGGLYEHNIRGYFRYQGGDQEDWTMKLVSTESKEVNNFADLRSVLLKLIYIEGDIDYTKNIMSSQYNVGDGMYFISSYYEGSGITLIGRYWRDTFIDEIHDTVTPYVLFAQ